MSSDQDEALREAGLFPWDEVGREQRLHHFYSASVSLLSMASPGNSDFGIQAFDSFIRIECANSEICHALQRYLFPPLPRSDVALSLSDMTLRVDHEDGRFRILLDNQFTASASTLEEAALAAVKALDEVVVHGMKMFRAVHAGAVLVDGRALLIPGSTHAGKSSLVAELLRRGASHFSDEYALIDSEGFVHAYPRPLLLRNGRPSQSLVLPEELNAGFAANPAPIGSILALDYAPDAEWDIHAISKSEAVMLLLRNTPHEMSRSPEMIDFFIRVAANAACYAGTRGDAAEAGSRIFDLIRSK